MVGVYRRRVQELASPAICELAKIWNVDKELGELLATYCRIQDTLDTREGRWATNGFTLEPWLQELEGYLYDTEDLVDGLLLSYPTNGENESQSHGKHPIRDRIIKSPLSTKPFTTPRKIVELRQDLERVSSRIGKVLGAPSSNSKQLHPEAPSSDHCYKSMLSDNMPFITGTSRDQDKTTIIEKLLKCHSSGVSIVGIDGLGKTSLARTILVDDAVKSHFPLILSASVSGDFHMTEIVSKLADSQRGDAKLLQDRLRKERALIILDDLWSVIDEHWQRFECNYLDLCPSGKILITTPNPKVAEVTKSIVHDMVSMTDEDCKKLIMERGNLSEFERDIEMIAKKCRGLPIIANKLGLELSKKQKAHEKKERIKELKNCNLWDLQEFRKVFLSLNSNELNLSFHHKRCFTYCSLFPPTHEFNKDELIQLWEVEGFIQLQHIIQPQRTRSSKLAVRKECFDDMLSRSILHPLKSGDNEQTVYKMHESKHWFAHLLASEAFFRVDEGTTSNSLLSYRNIRHLSLTNGRNIDESLLKKIEECKGLRTFLLLHQSKPQTLSISNSFFHKLQSLRLLDLSHTDISTLSKHASLSKHLRYLDLSYTKVDELPKHIQYLRALQVVKLKCCPKLHRLPKELNQLSSLTHLHFSVKKLGCLPSNMGKLTNLEVLDSFFVGKDEGYKVLELRNMKNLIEIHVSGLDNIKDRVEASEALLSEKPWMKRLVLEWNNAEAMNAEEVLDGLQPHDDLKVLEVRNYGGHRFPIWLTSPTCQLVSVYLDNCQNCQVLPSLGQLPILTNLVLHSIHNVKSVDSQFCGQGKIVFPCLELLEFHNMTQLAQWTGLRAGDMPCLRVLKIVGCPSLFNLPSFAPLSCLTNLEVNNCSKVVSLPELPLSLNGEFGELIITNSDLVKERCQDGEADWPKIKYIPYVEIDESKIITKSSSQPPAKDQDREPIIEHQTSTFAKLVKENNVSQGIASEDQTTSAHLQPTSTNQMASKTHNLQGYQTPSSIKNSAKRLSSSENAPQRSPSRGFGCNLFKGCFYKVG